MFSMKNFVGRFFSALQSAAYGACLGVLVASAVIVAEAVRDTGDARRAERGVRAVDHDRRCRPPSAGVGDRREPAQHRRAREARVAR